MKDLTKGSIAGHVLQFASFIALTTLFQTLYFLVDLYFVGTLGREAIAGVGLAGNVAIAVLALTQTLGVGTTALVSHAMGAKERARGDDLQSGVRDVVGRRTRVRHNDVLAEGRVRTSDGCGPGDGRASDQLPELVRTGDDGPVPGRRAGRGATRHRRHEDADRDVSLLGRGKHSVRADSDGGLAHGP